MLEVKEILDKKTWETFLDTAYQGFFPFFQTWDWGDVQKELGFPIFRFGLFNNERLIGVTCVVDVVAKRGHYLHLRHGPVLLEFEKKYFSFFLSFIKSFAKEKGASFIRMSPLLEKNPEIISLLSSNGFRNAPIHHIDADLCWVLDITKSEEELLRGMRKSHRYLIKKAQQENILITKSKDSKGIDLFLSLYKKIAQKRGFIPHRGIKEEIDILGKDDQALLFLAEYQKKIIAGILIDFVGNMAIYHHSASDDAYRHVPVSYLLQWEAILEAKRRGKTIYNFWGIAPENAKNHPWQGFTLFKTGFGGGKREFLPAMDLPISMGYVKNYLIELAFKIRKGY
ncbi:MAG: lipid II:glycine glycyltransferase FemX [Candidatus Levyibacteriota bacterium]